MLNRRCFLRATPALLSGVMALPTVSRLAAGESTVTPPEIGGSRRSATDEDAVATLELGARQSLRLLQFTDNHFFCGVKEGLTRTGDDRNTERDWQALVQIFKPDAVIVTGDLWHDNPGGRGLKTLEHAVSRLEELEVPWAFCWGNHDLLDDYQAGHDRIQGARNALYRGASTHGDYRIDIQTGASGRSLISARLWLLNSNRFGLTEWQLDWLRHARKAVAVDGAPSVPSLGFYHIPLLEQKTLYRPKVTPGTFLEEVCHEQESGQAAPVLATDHRLLACFCGHDHVNDYAVRTRQLDLVYGRATGHAGYGGEKLRKGAKLIELDLSDGTYAQETVFADGKRDKA